jgi:hypothetical protein
MKIRKNFRVSWNTFFTIPLVVAAIGVASLSSGKFFTDSNTYLSGYDSSFMNFPVLLYPFSWIFVMLCNCLIVTTTMKRQPLSDGIFLLQPYYLILITNFTKEAYLFLIAYLLAYFVSYKRNVFFSLLLFILVAIRAPYLLIAPTVLKALRSRSFALLILAGSLGLVFTFLIVYGEELRLYISSNIKGLGRRGYLSHTGREYFVNLCFGQKSDINLYTLCWAGQKFGLVYHTDLLSLNYILLMWFNFGFYFIVFQTLRIQKRGFAALSVCTLLIVDWIIFYHGPTAGAYHRYVYPVYVYFYFQNYFTLLHSRSLLKNKSLCQKI